jgi:hypothetical protein
VWFSVPGSADAGARVPFTFKTRGVSPRQRLVVQRQQGTKRVWRTVLKLRHANRGAARLPRLPLGAYNLRIAAVGAHRRVLSYQRHSLKVFGLVPLSTLFTGDWGTYVTPTRTFSWVRRGFENDEPGVSNPEISVSKKKSRCRSIHFDWLPGGPRSGGASETFTITLVQESHDPISASSSYQTVGALDVSLTVGESWALNASHVGGTVGADYYFNGFASCDSRAPIDTRPFV